MSTNAHINLDLSYPSTVSDKRAKLPSDNATILCPMHQKMKRQKEKAAQKEKKRGFFCNLRDSKTCLEKKLHMRGIKLKVNRNKKKVEPIQKIGTEDGNQDNKKLTKTELNMLANTQLQQIMNAFDDQIKNLSKEFAELSEENERHADDKTGLKMTVRRLEELALRVMKPWVNKMPHSDEMTRVMLLN